MAAPRRTKTPGILGGIYAVDVQRRRGEADPAEVLRVGALVGEAAGRTGRPALMAPVRT